MAIGFGIIGCGMISRFHAKAVADIKGAKVAACFDSFTSAADKFGAEIGCKVYHDLDEMLADKAVDVVTICTPSGVHMEPAVAAAKAGKHIIVEKPLDITLKRCDAMIAAAEEGGRRAFDDLSLAVSRIVAAPEEGDRQAAASAG